MVPLWCPAAVAPSTSLSLSLTLSQVERDAAQCYGDCSGRGECEAGFCRCAAPFWGIDCRMGHADRAPPPRCTAPPCVYVYELPARMNVLAEKADPRWRVSGDFKCRDTICIMPYIRHVCVWVCLVFVCLISPTLTLPSTPTLNPNPQSLTPTP